MAFYGLIPAAGTGSRMGGGAPKQYRDLAGKPMIEHTLAAFADAPEITRSYVVVSSDDTSFGALDLADKVKRHIEILPVGGATRHESVLNGLDVLVGQIAEHDWILVHDAARPGLTPALIGKLIESLRDDDVGGLLALPVADTLKRQATGFPARVQQTISRDGQWQAQTPQMFRFGLLRRVLRDTITNGANVTDEASAIEAVGMQPRLVQGSLRNFKVTWPDDLALAELILQNTVR